MEKALCLNCEKRVDYVVKKEEECVIIKGEKVNYIKKSAYCPICGEAVWVESLDDVNAIEPMQQYCRIHNLITIDKIKEILTKYNIGKRPLSLLLGWSELTVTRYLDGQLPSKKNSDSLLELFDTLKYIKLLDKNKNRIKKKTYIKTKKQIDKISQEATQYFVGQIYYYFDNSYESVDYEYKGENLCNCQSYV